MGIEETETTGTPAAAPQAPEMMADAMRQLEERMGPRIEEAKAQLGALNVRAKAFIRENPGTSLLAAVGVGYLIGKLASRR